MPGHTLEDFIFWRRIKMDAKWHKSARFQLVSAIERKPFLGGMIYLELEKYSLC